MTDSDLLRGLREQNPEAVRFLTRSYLPSIWRFVFVRVKGDSHLAEDIVSETVFALIKAAGDDVAIENLVAWMRSVAHNKVRDHFRSTARVRQMMKNVGHMSDSADHDDALALQLGEEKRDQVREVMDSLTEQHRLALEWKYLERLSVKEIADRWETTEKAAESVLFRARVEFRDRLIRLQKKVENPSNPPPAIADTDGTPPTSNGTPSRSRDGSQREKVAKR